VISARSGKPDLAALSGASRGHRGTCSAEYRDTTAGNTTHASEERGERERRTTPALPLAERNDAMAYAIVSADLDIDHTRARQLAMDTSTFLCFACLPLSIQYSGLLLMRFDKLERALRYMTNNLF